MDYLQHALNPLEKYFVDPDMIEIAVNPDGKVWFLKRSDIAMKESDIKFEFGTASSLIDIIAGKTHNTTGKDKLLVSASIVYMDRPIRTQSIIPPAVYGEAALSFRMFPSFDIDKIKLSYLYGQSRPATDFLKERTKTLCERIRSGDLMDTLKFCIHNRLNILISGGTETGKTVALRKLISLIDINERIITIEDAPELFPKQPNVVSLIADRSGEVRPAEKLLEASLRMRPDRLIIGEIRGKEGMTFLEAINTGHGGSISTLHAENPVLAIDRLAIAASRSYVPMSYDNLRNYISRTIDVIIQTGRSNANRGITEIYLPKENFG